MVRSADKPDVIALLGGTFDPVHHGHLRSAVELRQQLVLDEVHLVPCHQTPHREQPGRSSEQRLQMLQLAVQDEPGLKVDDRELYFDQRSYTVLTLQSLRQERGADAAICWVMGVDAFAHFTRWHRWQEILQLANLIVMTRPGFELDPVSEEAALWQARQCAPEQLPESPAGRIIPVHLPSQLEISATYIRQQLAAGASVRYLMPDTVLDYIRQHRLYRNG